MRLDHVVILVRDLERAMSDYSALGFTVSPGGEHAGGLTRNAVVAFEDGSYLELLAFTRAHRRALAWRARFGLLGRAAARRTGLERRFVERAAQGEGLIDFAIAPDAVQSDVGRAQGAGLEVEGPLEGGRTTSDGEVVRWTLAVPRAAELPFFCSDAGSRESRVPGGDARRHESGVVGIAGVSLVVPNLEQSSARFRSLLGVEPGMPVETLPAGVRARVFQLDGSRVTLLTGDGSGGPADPTRRGPGLAAVQLLRPERPFQLVEGPRTHGAVLELVPG